MASHKMNKCVECRSFLWKKIYRIVIVISWFILVWGLIGNLAFIRYSVVGGTDKDSSAESSRKVRTIADQFFHLESREKPTRNGFVSLLNGTLHIFSAVAYNSSFNSTYDFIALSAWEYQKIDRPYTYTCCMIYNLTNPVIWAAKIAEKKDWAYVGKAKIEVKQLVCPNVLQKSKQVPLSITIGQGKDCPKNMTSYVSVDRPMRQTRDTLAVCAKLVFKNISASSIVEWMEYQRSMNVSKVLAYISNLNADATKVLQYYSEMGFVEYFQYTLPMKDVLNRDVGVKNFQGWNDEQITVFDCIGRLAGYKFIGLYDMDEYIFPKKASDFLEMLRSLMKSAPHAGGFTFRTEIYASTWGEAANTNRDDMTIRRYNLRTPPVIDRVKSIIITDRVRPGRLSTHGYWTKPGFKKPFISSDVATTKHYRSCRKEWMKKGGEKCHKLIKKYEDESMFPVADRLAPRVQTVKRSLGLVG